MISVRDLSPVDQVLAFVKLVKTDRRNAEVAVDDDTKIFVALNTLTGWFELRWFEDGRQLSVDVKRLKYGDVMFLTNALGRPEGTCYCYYRGCDIVRGSEVKQFDLRTDVLNLLTEFFRCSHYVGPMNYLAVLAYALGMTSIVLIDDITQMLLTEVPCYKYRFWESVHGDIKRISF